MYHYAQNYCLTTVIDSCWGRPKKDVVKSHIEDMFNIFRNWNDVEKPIGISTKTLTLFRMGFFGLLRDGGGWIPPPLQHNRT